MKKTITTLVLSLILIFFNLESNAQQNYLVQLAIPPPGSMNMADFWNISVINNSNSEQSVYLIGTAKENKDGQIAKGTTVPFLLKKGANNIKIKDLPKTPDVEYTAKDPRYKESLIRSGKFPSGKYEICVKVISAGNNEELGSDCINQEVSETGMISLIMPGDGEEIEPKAPITFSWSSGGKIPEGGYTLKIVEVMNQQSNETAMKNNKALFEKKGIKSTSFQYPSSAARFIDGKKYAWGVMSGNSLSEVREFVLTQNATSESSITLISPKSNEPLNDTNNIKFEWSGQIPKGGFTLTVFEINEEQYKEIKQNKATEIKIEKPLFEKSGILTNEFVLRRPSLNLQTNHYYGWGVRDISRSPSPSFSIYGPGGPGGPDGDWQLTGNLLNLHVFNQFIDVWVDNQNSPGYYNNVKDPDEGGEIQEVTTVIGGTSTLGNVNVFKLTWKFTIDPNDYFFDPNTFVGFPFVIKIVKAPPHIIGVDTYVDSQGIIHQAPANPTCTDVITSGYLTALNLFTFPGSISYSSNITYSMAVIASGLPGFDQMDPGIYYCSVSVGPYTSSCFSFQLQ